MVYSLTEAIDILSRTPKVLHELLEDLNPNWLNFRKRDDAFSPVDVLGHLILGEKTDWIVRMKLMLSSGAPKTFQPFDRVGFDKGLGVKELLKQFENLREQNLKALKESVKKEDLKKIGVHPELGKVTLEQHLATWVVHDLTHLFQITETLSIRYKDAVGPWIEYLKILNIEKV